MPEDVRQRQESLKEYLVPRFEELLEGVHPFDADEYSSYCSYLVFADYHKMKLMFEYNQTDIEKCTE